MYLMNLELTQGTLCSLTSCCTGDMGVGKKIRKMAQAYYGRAAAYDIALGKAAPAEGNKAQHAALVEVLTRNLYPENPELADAAKLNALADELFALGAVLATRSVEDILAGHVFAA